MNTLIISLINLKAMYNNNEIVTLYKIQHLT